MPTPDDQPATAASDRDTLVARLAGVDAATARRLGWTEARDEPDTAADQRECQTCGYDQANHKREAHLYDPHPFCLTCPDHEACSQGAPCWKVKEVNGV